VVVVTINYYGLLGQFPVGAGFIPLMSPFCLVNRNKLFQGSAPPYSLIYPEEEDARFAQNVTQIAWQYVQEGHSLNAIYCKTQVQPYLCTISNDYQYLQKEIT